MPPIAVHHTDTVDTAWDGLAAEAAIPNDAGEGALRREYAWVDPDADPDTKAAYKFPHHEVVDGEPGAANENGCRNGLSRLPQSNVPEADHDGIKSHLQAHLDDAEKNEGDGEGSDADDKNAKASNPPAAASSSGHGKYGHLVHAFYDHPWAVTPSMFKLMAGILDFRSGGGVAAREEILSRIDAARADNGPRSGGATSGGVRVIPLYGVISQRQSLLADTSGGTSCDALKAELSDAMADQTISAIVFDVDSPGGDVSGITELAAVIRQARMGAKPIVAVVNTQCASAALWLMSGCDEIVCSPSGLIGSIGIIAMHEDVSEQEAMEGVKTTLISAGKFKTEGNQYEPLSAEARATIQSMADGYYSMFVGDVARGRGVPADKVESDFGQGRMLTPTDAKRVGLVDRIDTLDNTVNRLARGGGSKARARAEGEVIPFGERANRLAGEAAALAAHAEERARLRAKEGRPALSATTTSSLRSGVAALSRALATVDPTTSGSPLTSAVAALSGSRRSPKR